MPITPVEPDTLPVSPVFLQGAITPSGRTLYVGGQNGVDRSGAMRPDLPSQSAQAAANVLAVVRAAGADTGDIARLTVYLVGDGDLAEAYGAVAPIWGPIRTTVSVLRVAGLARPDALVEIDAIATLPPETSEDAGAPDDAAR